MAVPKRKTSTSKKRMRRSHHKLSSVNIVEDKKSGEYKLSHHIDLKSGYYNGKKNSRYLNNKLCQKKFLLQLMQWVVIIHLIKLLKE